MPLKRLLVPLVVAAAVGLGGYFYHVAVSESPEDGASSAPIVAITLPDTFSPRARTGQRAFDKNCAACHGTNAVGRDGAGPPLVHPIYRPGHHADESFQRAVAMGVMAHHWPFGNMPRVEGLNRREVALIVAYIRELQRVNGIN